LSSILYSVLALGFSFFLGGVILISLGIDFLGFLYMIVGSGATTILFLFIIMMLNFVNIDKQRVTFYKFKLKKWRRFVVYTFFSFLCSCFFKILRFGFLELDLVYLERNNYIMYLKYLNENIYLYKSNILQIGYSLYVDNPEAVFLISVILFVAVLGSVHFVLREK